MLLLKLQLRLLLPLCGLAELLLMLLVVLVWHLMLRVLMSDVSLHFRFVKRSSSASDEGCMQFMQAAEAAASQSFSFTISLIVLLLLLPGWRRQRLLPWLMLVLHLLELLPEVATFIVLGLADPGAERPHPQCLPNSRLRRRESASNGRGGCLLNRRL